MIFFFQVHPWLTRNDITTFCAQNNIAVEAYSPLTKGEKLNDPTLIQIAETYNKSPAQVLIRWVNIKLIATKCS